MENDEILKTFSLYITINFIKKKLILYKYIYYLKLKFLNILLIIRKLYIFIKTIQYLVKMRAEKVKRCTTQRYIQTIANPVRDIDLSSSWG